MQLEKQLVLNKYFLNLFGFNDFSDLSDKLKDTEPGYDNQGRSYFIGVLIGFNGEWEQSLLRYDEAIRDYVERLRQNRSDPNLNLKYFQYIAVLFTEIYLDKYYGNKQEFLEELNKFLDGFNNKYRLTISHFKEREFKKIAFWMATGSGKTLILHINYWQILKYSRNNWDNILLIAPNEGLSEQHYDELKLSGIKAKLYDGNEDNLKTKDHEVLVIDIYKLTKQKKGKGVSVDISYFDGKNLVFIDEGHKGQRAEEQKWKKLREEIAKNGFLFEYSATFGQVIESKKLRDNTDLFDEYTKAIIFDYSYKYFYTDGYGKDFYIYNIKTNRKKNRSIYSHDQQNLLLIASMLSYYEQLIIFEEHYKELSEYDIKKPLWIFVGSRVTGDAINSDIVKLIQFLDTITKDKNYVKETIYKILQGNSELIDKNGDDIFKEKFQFIKNKDYGINNLIENMYQEVFGGMGRLEVYEIKNAKGELGLKVSTAKKYFGVIYVGELKSLKKLLMESELNPKKDSLTQSLFSNINTNSSSINILIGAKKFIEGWNSWRVSNMGLLNMGSSEGPQIIQLFGRGVRLKGRKEDSLKREKNPDYKLKVLQTLFIFGLNADYIDAFLNTMAKEEMDPEEIIIPIKFPKYKDWNSKIYTIKTKDNFNFVNIPVKLIVDNKILDNVLVDLRPKITVRHEFSDEYVESVIDKPIKIPEEYLNIIDKDYIYSKVVDHKIARNMYNLILDYDTIIEVVNSRRYKIFLSSIIGISVENNSRQPVLKINSFDGVTKFQDIILMAIKEYMNKFYIKEEKKRTLDYLEAIPLTIDNSSSMYPKDKEIILKIPRSFSSDIKNVMEQLSIYCSGTIPANWKPGKSFILDLSNHLYTPLITWMKNKDEIKSMPVKLNKGETDFVQDFEAFINDNQNVIKNNEVFLLRNLSRKGIGFFLDSGFYPDFIIWVRKENKQHLIFIDPKGIRTLGNFKDEKIQLCGSYIKEIEQQINKELGKKGVKENLQLDSFILSVTPYNDIKHIFNGGNSTIDDFWKHNVIFQEENDYIKRIFKQVGALSKK